MPTTAALIFLCAAHALAATVDLPRYPAASPDGGSVVFSWRGDLWRSPATGGEALRLTTNPGDDLRSVFTHDGANLVFESTREGTRNIWVMPATGGEPRQLTFGDSPVVLGGLSLNTDGKTMVMVESSREGDLYHAPRPYMVALEGGPLVRVHDAFGSHPSSGTQKSVLFERGGNSWLRRGYKGPDARDVWMFTPGKPVEEAFRRLTSWPGNDGQAEWIDADTYLYLSDRDGAVNLYRKSLSDAVEASGTRLTEFTDDVTGFNVSADGKTVFLTRWDGLYRIDLAHENAKAEPKSVANSTGVVNANTTTPESKTNSKPQLLTITAAADEQDPVQMHKADKDITEALASPDGKTMAFVAYGDVFVRSMDEKAPVVRVTGAPSHEREIAWSPDGTRLYFVSDAAGNDDVMQALVSRTRSEIRKEANPPKKNLAKETEQPKEPAKPVDTRLDPARWTEAIAFDIQPVVNTPQAEREPQCSPDGKTLSFRRGGNIVLLDLATSTERVFRAGWDQEIDWRWSPDSKWIAFSQDDREFNRDVWIALVDGSTPPVNLTRHPDNDSSPRFSADGKLLAFLSSRVNNDTDVYTLALDPSVEAFSKAEFETYFKEGGDAAKKRKPLPGPNAKKPKINAVKKSGDTDGAEKKDAKDGADATDAKDETSDAKRSDDDKKDGDKSEGDTKDAKSEGPVYELDNAYLRVRRLTRLAGDESALEITPSGERVIFTGNDGGAGIYSVKWDGTEQKKVSATGRVTQINIAGDKVTLLQAGRVSTAAPAGGGEAKSVDFSATTPIDQRAWVDHRFSEAARTLGEAFYDPNMKGLDWQAQTQRYRALAKAARTDNEFEWCMARLLGELNASHTGVNVPNHDDANTRRPAGRLGARTRPVSEGFEIVALLPEGPAVHSQTPLKIGDVITAIAGEPILTRDALEQRLRGRVGEETLITVKRMGADGVTPMKVDCLITLGDAKDENDLLYKAATTRAAKLVQQWSNGRVGYIHIQSMSQPSLEDFERDLCAAAQDKDGLLVDVRNNGGGSTADRVLTSLMTQPHAYTVPRGADPAYTRGYPQDRLYIQRWTLPTNMLCNEKSFSNAEIVSHAFKHLKRGSLVGEQTYGGVISTGAATLVDGTSVRLPMRGWYTPDGRDMENNGALPDIRIPANPVDESRDMDAQLKAAVDDLLRRTPAPVAATIAAPNSAPAANAPAAGEGASQAGPG